MLNLRIILYSKFSIGATVLANIWSVDLQSIRASAFTDIDL